MIFENGTLVKGAYVVIGGVEYEVHMPEYSGNTPTSAENLNKMQEDLKNELTGEEIYNNENGINTNFSLTKNLQGKEKNKSVLLWQKFCNWR